MIQIVPTVSYKEILNTDKYHKLIKSQLTFRVHFVFS